MAIDSENKRRLITYILPEPSGAVTVNDRSHIAWHYFGLIATTDGAVHYITKSLKHFFQTISLDHRFTSEARKHHYITEDAEDV